MFETNADVAQLQRLFDRTAGTASPHMERIVRAENRLTARQVVAHLDGPRHIAFTTVAQDEPRSSPLNAIFVRGCFTMATARGSGKVRDLQANPACSAVYMEGERIDVVANGRVEWIDRGDPDDDLVVEAWTDAYGSDPRSWGDVVLFRLRPITMWAYAADPSEFAEA